jgi:hypothetical protein
MLDIVMIKRLTYLYCCILSQQCSLSCFLALPTFVHLWLQLLIVEYVATQDHHPTANHSNQEL